MIGRIQYLKVERRIVEEPDFRGQREAGRDEGREDFTRADRRL
jgi:hypothetical protein